MKILSYNLKSLQLSLLSIMAILLIACGGGVEGKKAKTKEAEAVKPAEIATETYALARNSKIEWVGSKKFVGDKHNGTVPVKSGIFEVAEDGIVGGNFILDMSNITNSDLEGEWQGKLLGHLKSPDFFDTAKFPTAEFTITNVEKLSGVSGATHKIKGNLTLKNTTKSIEFNADVKTAGDGITATTPQFVIDRTQWGVEYGSTDKTSVADDLKDKIISNDIGIKMSLTGGRVVR